MTNMLTNENNNYRLLKKKNKDYHRVGNEVQSKWSLGVRELTLQRLAWKISLRQ